MIDVKVELKDQSGLADLVKQYPTAAKYAMMDTTRNLQRELVNEVFEKYATTKDRINQVFSTSVKTNEPVTGTIHIGGRKRYKGTLHAGYFKMKQVNSGVTVKTRRDKSPTLYKGAFIATMPSGLHSAFKSDESSRYKIEKRKVKSGKFMGKEYSSLPKIKFKIVTLDVVKLFGKDQVWIKKIIEKHLLNFYSTFLKKIKGGV